MPYVKIELTDGATTEQKLQIYKETTEMLVRILNKNPEYTFVVIDEIAGENWGHKGTSVAEIRKAERAAAASAPNGAGAAVSNGAAKPAARKSTAKATPAKSAAPKAPVAPPAAKSRNGGAKRT